MALDLQHCSPEFILPPGVGDIIVPGVFHHSLHMVSSGPGVGGQVRAETIPNDHIRVSYNSFHI